MSGATPASARGLAADRDPRPPRAPRPAPRTGGQRSEQPPRAGKLETYLPRMRYTINGGVFGRLPGKWGDGAGGPRGWGPPGSGREGPAAGAEAGRRGFPPVTFRAGSARSQLRARPALQEREPGTMSGFVC